MLVQQLITDARRELLEYGAALFWSDSELVRLADRGQKDFCNRTRILESISQADLEEGRNTYPLPADWLSSRLVLHNAPGISSGEFFTRLLPSNLEKMAQEKPNFLDTSEGARGKPEVYWIWGNSLYIYPTPNSENATKLYLFYKSSSPTITSVDNSLTLDDTLSEGVLAYILWKAWAKEKETDLSEEQKRVYADYVGEGRRWLKKKSGDQRYRIDIDSPVSFSGNSGGFNPFS